MWWRIPNATTSLGKHANLNSGNFLRIGSGSLGGKARGLAFANSLITTEALSENFSKSTINIPKTIFVSLHRPDVTKSFDRVIGIKNGSIVLDKNQKSLKSEDIDFIYKYVCIFKDYQNQYSYYYHR